MDHASVTHIVDCLDDIFETVNIVQSILVVPDELADELYDSLVERDYPVAAYFCDDEVRNFISNRSRMLMVTECELPEFTGYVQLLTTHTNILINATSHGLHYLNLPNRVAIIHVPCRTPSPQQTTPSTDLPTMP